MKSQSTIEPSTFQRLGHNTIAYNFNITSEDTEEGVIYHYDQLLFASKPARDELINAVVQYHYPNGGEAAILRKALAVPDNEEYQEYFSKVETIKIQVSHDINKEIL